MKKKYLEFLIDHLSNNKKLMFNELVDVLKTKIENPIQVIDSEFLSELYQELILDNRFYLFKDKKIGLRENMSENTLKKINNNLTYTFEDYYGSSNKDVIKDVTLSDSEYLEYNSRRGKRKNKLDLARRSKDNLSKLNNSNKVHLADELGLTEDIDWNSIAEVIKDNN